MAAVPNMNPTAGTSLLVNNPAAYERVCIPPNSNRGREYVNVRNNLIPEFNAYQIQRNGAGADIVANGLAHYNASFAGDVFGGLMGCFTFWILFCR